MASIIIGDIQPFNSSWDCNRAAKILKIAQAIKYPKIKRETSQKIFRVSWVRLISAVYNSIIGEALGSIIATIITHHIRNTRTP